MNLKVVPLKSGGFRVKYDIDGKQYIWSSASRTLSGPNIKTTDVRMSDVFKKSNRRQIRSLIPVRSKKPRNTVSPRSVRGHRQKGGTCWFHSSINGLLYSPIARKILKNKLRFINAGQRLTNVGNVSLFSPDACPAKTASETVFWDYIRMRLSGGRRPVNASNQNVIYSRGIRNSDHQNTKGGNIKDMYALYTKLFPNDFKLNFIGRGSPTFVIAKMKVFPRIVPYHGFIYNLSHARLSLLHTNGISHAVTGFIDRNGTPKIYDSAVNKTYTYDWTVPFNQFGKYASGVKRIGVYVKQN